MASQSHLKLQVHLLCCFGFLLGLQRPSSAATPSPGHPAKPKTDLSPPKYEFGYEVRDDRGGQQGHLEARDGIYALGKYYVKLPDGSDQKVNYFTDDLGYHPLVEYNSASPSGSSRTQFAMGEKAVAALVKSISNMKSTEEFTGARKLANKDKVSNGQSEIENTFSRNSKVTLKPGSSVYIGSPSTPGFTSDIQIESSTPASAPSSTQIPYQAVNLGYQGVSETSHLEEDFHSVQEPEVSTSQPPQDSQILLHTLNLEGGGEPSPIHQSMSDFGQKLQNNALSTYLNIHEHKFVSTPVPVTSNYVEELVESATQRVSTTIRDHISSKNTEPEIPEQASTTATPFSTLHTNPYPTNNLVGVQVSPNGEDSRSKEILGLTTHSTTIPSTTFEDSSRKEQGDELGYTISTTPATAKVDDSFVRPIVVPDDPFEMQSFYNGLIRTTEEMRNFFANLNRTLIANGGKPNYKIAESSQFSETTSSPTESEDSASISEESSFHTSSNQILAPIQAAVSLSASELSSAEANPSEEIKTLESSQLSVEKQTLEKQPVLKTTIDIQKSIPFEIPHQNNYEEEEDSQSNENDENSSGVPFQQGAYLPIHQSINDEFSKAEKDAGLQSVRNQFLQQVYSAYKNLANNPNRTPMHTQINPANYQIPSTDTPTLPRPKKLFYVYLQNYNSGTNRYASSPQYSEQYQNVNKPWTLDSSQSNLLKTQYENLPPGSFSQTSANIYRNGASNLNFATFINHANLGRNLEYTKLQEDQSLINQLPSTNQGPAEVHNKNQEDQSSNENIQNYIHQHSNGVKDENHLIPLKVQYSPDNPQNVNFNQLNALPANNFQRYLDQTAKFNGGSFLENFNAGQDKPHIGNLQAVTEEGQNHQTNDFKIDAFFQNKFLGDERLRLQPLPTIGSALPLIPQVPLTWAQNLPLSRVAHLPYLQPYLQIPQTPLAYKPNPPYHPSQYLPLHNPVQIPLQANIQPEVFNRNDQQENLKKEGSQAPFRPSQKLYHSVYPPETYYVTEYLRPNARSRGLGKKLCIEYGGFKPPLIPSVQIDEKLEVNIGKRSDKND